MNIRILKDTDLDQLKEIHEKYYKDEFDFPNFRNKFLDCFLVEDNGVIVSGGGVGLIAESVLITNKEINLHKRLDALHMMLQANMLACGRAQINQLHCFVQDDTWQQWLEKAGFKKCKGSALFINV